MGNIRKRCLRINMHKRGNRGWKSRRERSYLVLRRDRYRQLGAKEEKIRGGLRKTRVEVKS